VLGAALGIELGAVLGTVLGAALGIVLGAVLGMVLGAVVGFVLGAALGTAVLEAREGAVVGAFVPKGTLVSITSAKTRPLRNISRNTATTLAVCNMIIGIGRQSLFALRSPLFAWLVYLCSKKNRSEEKK
jgi:hypothetical protein